MDAQSGIKRRTIFQEGERDYSIDIIRCISCFMVVTVHVFLFLSPSSGLSPIVAGSTDFYIDRLLCSIFTCGTDIFLMISGVFFLPPERNLKARKIWGKNILKMACAYMLWTTLYALVDLLYHGGNFTFSELMLHTIHQNDNARHLWYIPMMIGVYMIAPILRVFTAHAEQFHYKYLFVLVCCASVFNMYYTVDLYVDLPFAEEVNILIAKTPVLLFSNYFMLGIIGYWFYTYSMKKSSRIIIYILGIIGIASMFFFDILHYETFGTETLDYFGKFIFGNIFKCSAIFLFFSTILRDVKLKGWVKKLVRKLSGATLFIYLSHWMIIEYLVRNQWLMDSGLQDHIILIGFIYVVTAYATGAVFSIFFMQRVPWKKIRNAILGVFIPKFREPKQV